MRSCSKESRREIQLEKNRNRVLQKAIEVEHLQQILLERELRGDAAGTIEEGHLKKL